MSANELIKGYTPTQPIDIKKRDPLYNPDVRDMNDTAQMSVRDLKFKDQYYTMLRIGNQLKNGDGFTLGPNNKYLTKFDYDRQIDPNYLRRQDPKNQKHTESNDFYNGLTNGYYDIPKRIKRPVQKVNVFDAMDAYQYKSRFLQSGITEKTEKKDVVKTDDVKTVSPTKVETPKAPIQTNIKPMAPIKTLATDPTDDLKHIDKINNDDFIKKNKVKSKTDYQKILDEIELDRERSLLGMDGQKTSYDDQLTDKYGVTKKIGGVTTGSTFRKINTKPIKGLNI